MKCKSGIEEFVAKKPFQSVPKVIDAMVIVSYGDPNLPSKYLEYIALFSKPVLITGIFFSKMFLIYAEKT